MSAMSFSEYLLYGPSAQVDRRRPSSVPSQLLFREVNEQLFLRRDPSVTDDSEIEVVCECERRSCITGVRLSVKEYEAIRRFPTRFLMRLGHSSFEDERVVEDHDGFVVVEKTGPSAQVAIRLDPRKRRQEASRAA